MKRGHRHSRRRFATGTTLLAVVAHGCLFSSCRREDPARRSDAGLFTDITATSGIDFRLERGASGDRYLVETMIGGVGWIDHDGDGDQDLYLTNGHEDPRDAYRPGKASNRLFRNDGQGRFEDVTAVTGVGDRRYSNGVAVADYDNDGDSDLLVTNVGRNTLYRNRGDGTFDDVTDSAGLNPKGYNTSAVWFDLEGDGDLDLYIARYLEYHPQTARPCREGELRVYCHPRLFAGATDLLFKNLGDGSFVECGEAAGVARAGPTDGKGLGVVALDHDADGDTDLYVANDTTPNFLWRNNGDGTFTEVAHEMGIAVSDAGKAQAGMGVDWGDVNGDGLIDIHVTNFSHEANNLFLGLAGGGFRDAARGSGLGESFLRLGFGTLLADFDLDGDLDLAVANGHVDDVVEQSRHATGSTYRQPTRVYFNDGRGLFLIDTERSGPALQLPVVGRGLASADMDGDGDLDLALVTQDRSLVLLRNNGAGNHYLGIRLRGTKGPRDAYGAKLRVEVGDRAAVFDCQSARSYLSAVDPRITVGLGQATRVDRLTVRWPGGGEQRLENIAANRTITVTEE